LENRRSQNDEVFRGVWEIVETGARKIGMKKAKRRRSEGGSWKEERKERKKEEIKKGKDNGGEEGSRGIENMG